LNDADCAIEIRYLNKTFGTVAANRNINLSVSSGEILALLGENGSGKTTLMNMLSGIYQPDSGEIRVRGRPVLIRSPRDAVALGIGMIHQHFKLVDVMSAKENIVLGDKGKGAHGKRLTEKIRAISARFGLEIDPDKLISDMSVGEKQTVEILKVLYRGSDILILDEPTAVLTPQETRKLFSILHQMKREGCAVIIITHKLDEVMEVSDRVTILRKGESVGSAETSSVTVRKLTELMVGRPVSLSIDRPERVGREERLTVTKLTALNDEGRNALTDINFSLYGGEILGVAGVAGSGQRALCEAIAGLWPVETGSILLDGRNIVGLTPREIIQKGISMSFVPEDRLGMGLVASMSIVDNMLLKDYQNQRGFLMRRAGAASLANELVERLDISTPSIAHPVRQLSGGNVQKVLLGREIQRNPSVLITAYPVRGLDVGSSFRIYDLLNEQKKKGVAILFIGESLDVLMELCDRILVLADGRMTGLVDAEQVTKEELGQMMTRSSHAKGAYYHE